MLQERLTGLKNQKAPEGYKKVPAFDYKVKDTGDIQTIKVSDERSGDATPATPNWRDSGANSPQTGEVSNPLFWITLFLISLWGIVISRYRKIRKKMKKQTKLRIISFFFFCFCCRFRFPFLRRPRR